MTGLFHRLAQQVLGPDPPRARTAARLPFAAAPMLDEPRAEMRRPEAPPSVAAPEEPSRQGESGVAESGSRRGPARTSEPPRMNAAPGEPAPDQAPGAPHPPETVAETRTDAVPQAVGPRRQGAAPDGPGRPPTPAAGEPAAADATGRRDQAMDGEPRQRAPDPPAASETPRAPRPLFPPTDETPRAAPAADPVRPSRRFGAEPPEIHVRIGRIDVASVNDPQPQQRREPPRRKPAMSLEDHLAKRKSGG